MTLPRALLFLPLALASAGLAADHHDPAMNLTATKITTSQKITPLAAPGSVLLPFATNLRSDENANGGFAVTSALSPDGTKLLVLTSGSNTGYSNEDGTAIVYPVLDPITGQPTGSTTSNAEWIFLYDVSQRQPTLLQRFNISNTYIGLAWDVTGSAFSSRAVLATSCMRSRSPGRVLLRIRLSSC